MNALAWSNELTVLRDQAVPGRVAVVSLLDPHCVPNRCYFGGIDSFPEKTLREKELSIETSSEAIHLVH